METLRFLFIILNGYAGLFRISEVLSIRVCDIDFHECYMCRFERMTSTATVIRRC